MSERKLPSLVLIQGSAAADSGKKINKVIIFLPAEELDAGSWELGRSLKNTLKQFLILVFKANSNILILLRGYSQTKSFLLLIKAAIILLITLDSALSRSASSSL